MLNLRRFLVFSESAENFSLILFTEGGEMRTLEGIGCVRFCMSLIADCMVHIMQGDPMTLTSRNLIGAAELACRNWEMAGARWV